MQLLQIGNAKPGNADGASVRAERWRHLRPHSVQVYIENRCHLRCAHCYESEETHPTHQALTLPDYERLFDDLARLGVLFMTMTGGEVFLRRDALDIIAAARKRRFAVTLYTSGTLLDEAKADRLAELKVHDVHISVYSHLAGVHDDFTGIPRSHERSVRALALLHARGIRTVLKANLMTFNVDHIDGMIALARSVGADFKFDPTVKPKMNGDRTPLRFALSPDQIRKKVLSRPDLYEAFQKNRPDAYCTGEASIMPGDKPMCGAAREVVSVGADGSVYACGLFPVAAGTLRERSLEEIWFGSAQLDAVRSTTLETMAGCTSCDVRSTCGPCMAYAQVEHDDHRGCATSSRQLAEAVRSLATTKVRADEKMSTGRQLPILGELHVPRPLLKGGHGPNGGGPLITE